MATLSMTTNELVRQSYKMTGLLTNNDAPTSPELADGLLYLNLIISTMNANQSSIPFFGSVTFNTVVNQAVYTISNNIGSDITSNPLVDIQNCVIVSNGETIPLTVISYQEGENTVWASTNLGQPYYVMLKKSINSTSLTFYPTPNNIYQVLVNGKFALGTVVKNQDLSILPGFYFEYLTFKLANRLSLEYPQGVWDARHEKALTDLQAIIDSGNSLDPSLQPTPTLQYYGWYSLPNAGVIII